MCRILVRKLGILADNHHPQEVIQGVVVMEGEVEGEGEVVDLPHPTGGITMAHRLMMILTLTAVPHHLTGLRRPTLRVSTLYPPTGMTMGLGATTAAPRGRVRT